LILKLDNNKWVYGCVYSKYGWTPLHQAVEKGKIEIIKLLIVILTLITIFIVKIKLLDIIYNKILLIKIGIQ